RSAVPARLSVRFALAVAVTGLAVVGAATVLHGRPFVARTGATPDTTATAPASPATSGQTQAETQAPAPSPGPAGPAAAAAMMGIPPANPNGANPNGANP